MINKRYCKGCGEEIHPKRLEILPLTQVCVECSSTEKKQGLTIQVGEGDHTYNDIIILDPQHIREYEDSKEVFEKDDVAEFLDFETKESSEIPLNFKEDFEYKQPQEAPEEDGESGPDRD